MKSYRGFDINVERTDAASPYLWWVTDIGGHVYHCCGKDYECSGDAERAAEQWIDFYIKSLPNTDTTKTALRFQERLKGIEEELQKLTDSPYADHYRGMDAKGDEDGAKIVTLLFDALENVTEALKINEQTIRKISREND